MTDDSYNIVDDGPEDERRPSDDDLVLPPDEAAQLAKFDAELDLEPDEDVDEFVDQSTPRPAAKPVDELANLDAELSAPGFYEAGLDLHAMDDLTLQGRPSVLERLGPAHFRSKGFSFMGFLQTVYDHVAGQVKKDGSGESSEAPVPSPGTPGEG